MATETNTDGDGTSTQENADESIVGGRRQEELINAFRQVFENPLAKVGAALLIFFLLMALFGPAVAPYSPDAHQTNPDGSW